MYLTQIYLNIPKLILTDSKILMTAFLKRVIIENLNCAQVKCANNKILKRMEFMPEKLKVKCYDLY